MNFSYKPSPHIKRNKTTEEILTVVLMSLLFVSVWGIYNQYIMFGTRGAFHGVNIILVTCAFALITHFLFYIGIDYLEGKKFKSIKERISSNIHKIKDGAPLVTALILALCFPSGTPLYVAAVSIVFAEIFAKLIYGGFGQNIFNPAGVGYVFASIVFGSSLAVPYLVDATSAATPLNSIAVNGWIFTEDIGRELINSYGGYTSMLLGSIPGSIGETARLAVLIALGYMCYKKVLDWTVPVFYIGTIFIISYIIGLRYGLGIWYPTFHLLSGGLIFGAVFMATDPVTNPVNRQGRIIFAILLGMITLILRFKSNHPEGVMYSILLMNMFVPVIDSKTSNVTIKDTKMKWLSVIITFVVALIVVSLFTINLQPVS